MPVVRVLLREGQEKLDHEANASIHTPDRTLRITRNQDSIAEFQSDKWLQVLGAAERSQVHQRIRHQLHPVVPLLNALKAQEEPFEFVLPRKGPLDTHP
jgi:hypothetical protein